MRDPYIKKTPISQLISCEMGVKNKRLSSFYYPITIYKTMNLQTFCSPFEYNRKK